MSAIVSWEYYSSLFNKSNQTDFTSWEAKAEQECKRVIGPIKWAEINSNTFGYDELKYCICKVIDRLIDDESSAKGKGVTSVSNDGYSESYSVVDTSNLYEDMNVFIRAELSGTGLVGAY